MKVYGRAALKLLMFVQRILFSLRQGPDTERDHLYRYKRVLQGRLIAHGDDFDLLNTVGDDKTLDFLYLFKEGLLVAKGHADDDTVLVR